MVLAGVALAAWIAYVLLIAGRPPGQGPGAVIVPILFSAGLIGVGLKWARE